MGCGASKPPPKEPKELKEQIDRTNYQLSLKKVLTTPDALEVWACS